MEAVFAELVPLALIVAVSPIILIPMLVLLLSPSGKLASRAFLVACAGGIALVVTVAVGLSALIERESTGSAWAAWTRIGIGVGLLALAAHKWHGRRDDAPPSPWMTRLNDAAPSTARRFGFIVSLANPKVLAIATAAGLVIGQSDLPLGGRAVAVVVFVLLAVSGVTIAFTAAVVGGDAADAALAGASRWLDRHRTSVAVAVLLLLSALLIGNGVAALNG